MLLLVVLYALIALSFVLAKKALLYADPYVLVGIRMVVAGTLLLGYEYLIAKRPIKVHKADWIVMAATAWFHIYCAFVPEFWALQYVSALKTTLMYASTPFVTALLSYVLLTERLSLRQWFGMAIGFAGLCPMVLGDALVQTNMTSFSLALPDMVMMTAIVSACYAWFLVKKLMHKGYTLPTINGTSMIGGGLLSLITAAAVGSFRVAPVTDWGMFAWWTGLLILLANVVVYNLYGSLLRTYSLTLITFAGFLSPIFGAFFEVLITGNLPDPRTYLALVSITLGLYLFSGTNFYSASPKPT